MLTQPAWVPFNDLDKQRLRHLWDDTLGVDNLHADDTNALGQAMQMSLRARLVLCTGLYEWVVWRFDGLHDRPQPRQIAEVAWCATVDPRYMKFFELTRSEWLGAIEGPQWMAATWLQPALSNGYRFPRDLFDGISMLTRVVLHVVPEPERFRAWLTAVLKRLVQLSPALPDDPCNDPFDRRVGQRLGPLLGRTTLDPAVAFDRVAAQDFLSEMLVTAHATGNPFLASPEDLRDVGFVGQAYALPVNA